MCRDILDHVADEIRSNKARITLQLNSQLTYRIARICLFTVRIYMQLS